MMWCFPLLLVVAGIANARWVDRQGRSSQPRETSFVGDATNELSTAILQSYIDDEKNIAFSPLGYSAILAILAEGAEGDTKNQLVTALHLPENVNVTRKTFHFIMQRLKNTNEYKYNRPELKNYFYIYKNYTINDGYKKILEECYLTEVRSVERYTGETDWKTDEADKTEEFTIEIPERKPEEEKKVEILELVPPPKESTEKFISFAVEDKPEKADVTNGEYKPAKNIHEKIKLVKITPTSEHLGDEEETMVAVEARNQPRGLKVLNDKNDVTASISVNSVGKKSNTSPSNSLMIIFNGMYFRGSWKKAFEKVEPALFYMSNKEKKLVPTMKSHGSFRSGFLPGLDSEALEVPYDGGRYSLLIILPRSREGLTRLVADLPSIPLCEIHDNLSEEMLQISIPTFYVETTTKPVAALAKFGVSNIFSRDAELTGVSATEGLFVQELVQHVAVRVDNTETSASALSASNPSEPLEQLRVLPPLDIKPGRRFSVEHPFLFFIVDHLDKLVLVSGKVNDPEQPMPFSDF